eukprot:2951269-Lingulodinium_polyedra.AAC.1
MAMAKVKDGLVRGHGGCTSYPPVGPKQWFNVLGPKQTRNQHSKGVLVAPYASGNRGAWGTTKKLVMCPQGLFVGGDR